MQSMPLHGPAMFLVFCLWFNYLLSDPFATTYMSAPIQCHRMLRLILSAP